MNNKTIYYTVLAFALLASLIFGVFMTLSISQSADSTIANINAYSADKVKYFNLISWVFVACLIIFLFFTFTQKKYFGKSLKISSGGNKAACLIGGGVSALVVVFNVVAEIVSKPFIVGTDNAKDIDGFYRFIKYTALGKSYNLPYIGLMIVLALTAVYFFYCAFKAEKKAERLAVFSLCPVLAFGAKLIFDFLMQNSNGFGKLYNYHLLSLGFMLLFFVNETRFYIKKPAPALYIFFGLAASVATSIYSIPILILYTANVIELSGINLMFSVMDIFFVAYIYTRLFKLSIREPKHNTEKLVKNP